MRLDYLITVTETESAKKIQTFLREAQKSVLRDLSG